VYHLTIGKLTIVNILLDFRGSHHWEVSGALFPWKTWSAWWCFPQICCCTPFFSRAWQPSWRRPNKDAVQCCK